MSFKLARHITATTIHDATYPAVRVYPYIDDGTKKSPTDFPFTGRVILWKKDTVTTSPGIFIL